MGGSAQRDCWWASVPLWDVCAGGGGLLCNEGRSERRRRVAPVGCFFFNHVDVKCRRLSCNGERAGDQNPARGGCVGSEITVSSYGFPMLGCKMCIDRSVIVSDRNVSLCCEDRGRTHTPVCSEQTETPKSVCVWLTLAAKSGENLTIIYFPDHLYHKSICFQEVNCWWKVSSVLSSF